MNGKSKCKILKEIRREIARQNDIEFVTSECKFQGNCTGTCPKCESEVRYLEQELAKRRNAGKAVAVAGIAAAMMLSAAGCVPGKQQTAQPTTSQRETTQESTQAELLGDVEISDGLMETEPFMGEPAVWETTAGAPTEGDIWELPGRIPDTYVVGEVPES